MTAGARRAGRCMTSPNPLRATCGAQTLRAPQLVRLLCRGDPGAHPVVGPDYVTGHRRHGTHRILDQDVVAVIADPIGADGRFLIRQLPPLRIELGDSVRGCCCRGAASAEHSLHGNAQRVV